MNCSKCGQPLDPGAVFCGNCGQAVAAQPTAAPQPTDVNQAPPTPNSASQPSQPAGVIPAYAVAPVKRSGETKAFAGLILGILAIPGAIIPIFGLVFGIAAIVLSSISIRIKRSVARLGLIFGIVGILLSIAAVIYNVQNASKGDLDLGDSPQSVSTTCYDLKLNKVFHVSKSDNSCVLVAYNGSTRDTSNLAYVIESSDAVNVTSANFEKDAKTAAPVFAQGLSDSSGRTFSIKSQYSGKFAGKQAYYVDVKDNKGGAGEFAMVLADAPNGDNLFVFGVVNTMGSANLKSLEPTVNWK